MHVTIAILNTRTSESMAVSALSEELPGDTRIFDNLGALESWLRHGRDNAQNVAAVLVDAEYFEVSSKRIIFSSILAIRSIPLIVVGAAGDNRHWCEISAAVRAGMPVYLATLQLLPDLLAHLGRCGPTTNTSNHSSQIKGREHEETRYDRGRFGHGTTDDRFHPA